MAKLMTRQFRSAGVDVKYPELFGHDRRHHTDQGRRECDSGDRPEAGQDRHFDRHVPHDCGTIGADCAQHR